MTWILPYGAGFLGVLASLERNVKESHMQRDRRRARRRARKGEIPPAGSLPNCSAAMKLNESRFSLAASLVPRNRKLEPGTEAELNSRCSDG